MEKKRYIQYTKDCIRVFYLEKIKGNVAIGTSLHIYLWEDAKEIRINYKVRIPKSSLDKCDEDGYFWEEELSPEIKRDIIRIIADFEYKVHEIMLK